MSTPAGEHEVPAAVQALLAVEWPPHQSLRRADSDTQWEVHLPSPGEVGRMVVEDQPRAWFAIGYDEGQWYWLVDLAEADSGDFPAYYVDHDGSDDASGRHRISSVLDGLRVMTDRMPLPSGFRDGEASAMGDVASADALITDANALVNTDPATLVPFLDRVTTAEGRLAATVYRTSLARNREADAATRRQALALDAARHGALDLSRSLAAISVPGVPALDWTIEWATGAALDQRIRSRLDVGGPQAIAEIQGSLTVATLDGWTLRVHDLAGAEKLVETYLECAQDFTALALARLDGRWVAVTGSGCPGCSRHDTCEGQIRQWNLADGRPIGGPVHAHIMSVDALAVRDIGGRPTILSGGHDRVLRMWDMRTGEPVGTPSAGHRDSGYGGITSVAAGELDGRPIAVTGGWDGTARLWDLANGGVPRGILTANSDQGDENAGVFSVSLGELDGLPVALTGGNDSAQVWDLRSGRQLGPMVTHRCQFSDLTEIDGRPVAVTVDFDGRVRMWDLRTREELGSEVNVFPSGRGVVHALTVVRARNRRPMAVVAGHGATAVVDLISEAPRTARVGHTDAIKALTVAGSGSPPVVVTGGTDRTAQIWDLDGGAPVCPPLSGHDDSVDALATARIGGRPVVLTCDGRTMRLWDRSTGELWREIATTQAEGGHQVLALATAYVNGRAVAVTGGYDGRILAWDLERAARPDLVRGEFAHSLTTVETGGRHLALVPDDKAVGVLDLTDGERLNSLDHKGQVNAVAVTESWGRAIAVTTTYRKLHVWDVAAGTRTDTIDTGDSIGALAIGHINGRLIAAGGGFDQTVRTWDLADGLPYRAALTFPKKVEHLAITSQGHLVAAFGSDLAVFSSRS